MDLRGGDKGFNLEQVHHNGAKEFLKSNQDFVAITVLVDYNLFFSKLPSTPKLKNFVKSKWHEICTFATLKTLLNS